MRAKCLERKNLGGEVGGDIFGRRERARLEARERGEREREEREQNKQAGVSKKTIPRAASLNGYLSEGCSENRRETAKRDRKRWTPKGGRRLAHHTPLLKSLCGGGVPFSHPSLGLSVFFLSFGPGREVNDRTPSAPRAHR